MQFGIRVNLGRFLQQLPQVLRVGMTTGIMRNVVLGFVKGAMNFVAGRLAERIGCKRVLLQGWLAALCQAGLVEKFVDALVWAFWPVYLPQRGVGLPGIGWIVGVHGFTWGAAQFFTGKLSDRVGRHLLNVGGLWICGAGVALMPLGAGAAWWSASAIGIDICRFWRDLGYGIGALGLGVAVALGGRREPAFWFIALARVASGAALWRWGEETHPRGSPAP